MWYSRKARQPAYSATYRPQSPHLHALCIDTKSHLAWQMTSWRDVSHDVPLRGGRWSTRRPSAAAKPPERPSAAMISAAPETASHASGSPMNPDATVMACLRLARRIAKSGAFLWNLNSHRRRRRCSRRRVAVSTGVASSSAPCPSATLLADP